jgi:hypothetical protein
MSIFLVLQYSNNETMNYSQTCLSDHLYIATTCTSGHLFSTPLRFPYITYLYIETTCLTRPATKRFPTKTVANPPITTGSLSVRQVKVWTRETLSDHCSLDWVHKHLCATLTDCLLIARLTEHTNTYLPPWPTRLSNVCVTQREMVIMTSDLHLYIATTCP